MLAESLVSLEKTTKRHIKIEEQIKFIFKKFIKYFQKKKLASKTANVYCYFYVNYLINKFNRSGFEDHFKRIPFSKKKTDKNNKKTEIAIPNFYTIDFLRRIGNAKNWWKNSGISMIQFFSFG